MKAILFSITLLTFILSCTPRETEIELTKDFLKEQLDKSLEIAYNMAAQCPDSLFPRSYQNGEFITSGSDWWCSGFYPGLLVYLYEYSNDKRLENEILNRLKYLEKEKYNSNDHDIGFKINCSFGNMLRVSGDTLKYSPIIIQAARTAVTRFNSKLGVIRSWNNWKKDWQYAVIIDNMMNLELLLTASELSGDSSFTKAAISHADKTIENHFREDNSSWHVVSYDTISGVPHLKQTHQGQSDESAWARGQAWGLYGFTVMYAKTRKNRYLEQAIKIAEFMLNHKNVPDDNIFYWDFDADNIPNAKRDASAAAITASALITLSDFTIINSHKYLKSAEKIIRNLSAKKYQAEIGENGNFILKHSVGSLPGNSEVDVPLSYADYYYVEALMKLYNKR